MKHKLIQKAATLLIAPHGALVPFIGHSQRSALMAVLASEEGDFFAELLTDLHNLIETMPVTYQTDGQGKAAIAHLHYFMGGYDAYVTEKDVDGEEGQRQAYGYQRFRPNDFEAGYVSIADAIRVGAELDLYFTPKPVQECIG